MSNLGAGLVAIVVFTAGCGLSLDLDVQSSGSEGDSSTFTSTVESVAETPPTTAEPEPNPPSTDSPPTTQREFLPIPDPVTTPPTDAGPYGEVIVRIESFWNEVFADFAGSGDFIPLDRDRILGVSDGDNSLPDCDNSGITSRSVEDNAFAAVCSEGQLIVWDEDDLFVELLEDYGETGPAIVLAHELGHAAQFQAGVLRRMATVIAEQQADCLAGAYASWAANRGIAPFDVPESLDAAVGATVSFRDQPGTTANNSGAHGSGFDRVRAFQDGFDRGVEFCSSYPDTPPPITEIGFTAEEFPTGGNLPFSELIETVTPYFNDFFRAEVPGWVDLNPDPNDLFDIRREHLRVGDNSTGTRLAMQFAAEAQTLLELETVGEGPLLQQACVAGGVFEPLFFERDNSPDQLRLSAGDLDEAVITLTRIVETSPELPPGFLFELVAALRLGFTEGVGVCRLA